MADMVELCRFTSTPEAQIMQSRLKDHGIITALQGENLAGTTGLLGQLAPCRVLVHEDLLDEARTALAVMAATDAQRSKDAPQSCGSCGERWEPGFQECWNCQAPLP